MSSIRDALSAGAAGRFFPVGHTAVGNQGGNGAFALGGSTAHLSGTGSREPGDTGWASVGPPPASRRHPKGRKAPSRPGVSRPFAREELPVIPCIFSRV